jgi:hypothetical protein
MAGQPAPEPSRPNPVVMNPPRPQPQPEPRPNPVVMNPPRPQPEPAAVPASGTKWSVYKDGASCRATSIVSCPPKVMCNPPPPQDYTCPEGVSLTSAITIVSNGSECMIEQPPMHCPPRAMCNPPRPRIVACPK